MRSATHRCNHGCVNRFPQSHTHDCCIHDGYQYGWRPGPHVVKCKNTACHGKCDTFGNLAFKSKNKAYLPPEDDVSELSSVNSEKLENLESLILEEHNSRKRAETDVNELKDINETQTSHLYKADRAVQGSQRIFAEPTEAQLNDLLRQIKDIVQLPLNQINIDLLMRIIRRQEIIMRKRHYDAAQMFKYEDIAKEYMKADENLKRQGISPPS